MPPTSDDNLLVPPEVAARLPPIFGSEDKDATAFVKLILPGTGWAFYLAEYGGKDGWYGLWCGHEIEQGIFFLSDVAALRSPIHGFPVERDDGFTPTKLSELRRLHLAPGQPVFSNQSLLPPELRAKLAALDSQAGEVDPIAYFKFALPGSRYTWYVCSFDGEDACFGLIAGETVETGYFSLSEVQGLCNPYEGDPIERDDRFTPARLSALRPKHVPGIVWSPWPAAPGF